jgi:hypothetical protein
MSRSDQVVAGFGSALILGVLSLLGVVLTGGNAPTFIMTPAGSTPSPAPSESITSGDLTLTDTPNYYLLILPIYERSSEGQQIREFSLTMSWGGTATPCPVGGGSQTPASEQNYRYVLDGTIKVASGAHTAEGSLRDESGVASGSSIQAIGTFQNFCDDATLDLDFTPPALTLDGSTTTISIELPKIMTVSQLPSASPSSTARPQNDSSKIVDPTGSSSEAQYAYVQIDLFASIGTGEFIGGCAELTGLQISRKQASSSCHSQIPMQPGQDLNETLQAPQISTP